MLADFVGLQGFRTRSWGMVVEWLWLTKKQDSIDCIAKTDTMNRGCLNLNSNENQVEIIELIIRRKEPARSSTLCTSDPVETENHSIRITRRYGDRAYYISSDLPPEPDFPTITGKADWQGPIDESRDFRFSGMGTKSGGFSMSSASRSWVIMIRVLSTYISWRSWGKYLTLISTLEVTSEYMCSLPDARSTSLRLRGASGSPIVLHFISCLALTRLTRAGIREITWSIVKTASTVYNNAPASCQWKILSLARFKADIIGNFSSFRPQ